MPRGTSRASDTGKPMLDQMSTMPFSAQTVLPEISVARIAREAPHSKASVMGCGVPKGTGAVRNAARGEAVATVAAFGLGASAWR
jgi:S-(hydroxymethyl)glutathione dehydrogenase/alcohol dehydrogenase